MSMEETKYCQYCDKNKPLDAFQKSRAKCRPCRTLETKKWKQENSDQHYLYQKEYKAKRYKSDLNFKIKVILRSRVRKFLKNNWKSGSSVDMLGCSVEDFKLHIESKWQEGMSWDNWSKLGWHLDHILPLDSFDLSKPEDMAKACHFTNLQPLWALENCIKSNKVE